jgi:hypothetical protein
MGVLDVWSLFAPAERDQGGAKIPRKAWALIEKVAAKVRATTNVTLLPKVARRRKDGTWRFVGDPPVLTRVDAGKWGKVAAALVEYAENLSPADSSMLRRYALADVAHRVVDGRRR